MPNPQILRSLSPRQATCLHNADRIPLELAAGVAQPYLVSLIASFALKKTGTKPRQVQNRRAAFSGADDHAAKNLCHGPRDQ